MKLFSPWIQFNWNSIVIAERVTNRPTNHPVTQSSTIVGLNVRCSDINGSIMENAELNQLHTKVLEINLGADIENHAISSAETHFWGELDNV